MIIATRLLKLRYGEREYKIPIGIHAPVRDGKAWSCTYTIGWPEGTQSMKTWGADSAQALVLALQMIGSDLYTSSYHNEGRLALDDAGGGYGFPVPNNMRHVLTGDDMVQL